MLPSDFPKWRTVYAYFEKWRSPGQDGISVLEQALKKSAWRGPLQTGAERLNELHHRRRTEREEHR
jgi:transposase